MNAAHPAPPPPPKRVPPAVRTALAWSGAVAFPFVLYVEVLNLRPSGGDPGGDLVLRIGLSALVMGLLVGLLRRRPLVALALMLAGAFFTAVTLHSPELRYLHILVADLAVGYLVATRRPRVWVAAMIMALVGQVAIVTFQVSGNDLLLSSLAFVTLALVTAGTVGYSVRERREHAEALRARTAAQAVTAERLRIARELHDMVAHSIGIIAIQAGVGRRVIDTQPVEARNALAAVEATSRETLAGLRRTLAALRRSDSGGGPDPAPLDPAPGLADVDRLAASALSAGVRVDVRWQGQRRPVPADIDLAAYRITQEAVTNVVRHAGTRDCRVTIDYGDEELAVEVVDDGRGCAVAGIGYGIVGMRERVDLLRGDFSAGPRPGGGFKVAARLPLAGGVR